MKRNKKKVNSNPSRYYFIQFCDLSGDLDRGLSFLADLLQASEDRLDDLSSETGHSLHEYLGRRAALEHVFFGRPLISIKLEASKLKAELWRIHKMKAGLNLKNRSKAKGP